MTKELRYNLIAPILLMLISWAKYFDTNSIAVDDNFFRFNVVLSFSIVFYYFSIIFSFYRFFLLYKNDFEINEIVKLARWINLICLFSLPLFSSDMFSIFGYSAELNSTQIYHKFHLETTSFYYPYVCKLYRETPCVYGPLTILLGKLSQVFSSNIIDNFFLF